MIRRIREAARIARDVARMAWYLVGAVASDEPPPSPTAPATVGAPKVRVYTWNLYTVKVGSMLTPDRWEGSVWLGGVMQYLTCYERTAEEALAKAQQWAFEDHAWKKVYGGAGKVNHDGR